MKERKTETSERYKNKWTKKERQRAKKRKRRILDLLKSFFRCVIMDDSK